MPRAIRKVAVLGAGLMGSQIAAHLANVGFPTLLLDIVPRELTPDEAKKGLTLESKAVRNRFANGALQNLKALKPSRLFTQDVLSLITPGNFEDDLAKIAECDWVLEAVVENLAIKQDLLAKVAAVVKPGTIVSSNTSGISVEKMTEGLPAEFRQHFLVTHFFNPPRYMKLLEIVPTTDTDPAIMSYMQEFGEQVLGKGVVIAKDTPNFIANRIGTYGMMVTMDVMQRLGLTPDVVDSLTGKAMGRPKSATFRTLDVVGLDTFVHVADNCKATIQGPDAEAFTVPEVMREMVRRGMLGQKAKQGFFKKEGDQILTLNLETLEYEPRKKANFPSLEQAKQTPDLKDRVRVMVYGQDKGAQFVWEITKQTLLYAANLMGEIADDIMAVDNALKWGFNWEAGPFETWDAIGLSKSIARMEAEGATVPAWVKAAAEAGGFYKREPGMVQVYLPSGDYQTMPQNERIIDVAALNAQGKVVKAKKGASLIDLGDGVLMLENHSPKTALGVDMFAMMKAAAEELHKDQWRGLVIGATHENFCVGANVMMMLMEAQDEEWEDIELMARQAQNAAMALKYAPKPVVGAPYGLTLGGGYEAVACADMIVAAAETYMGLVEVGAGLIPGMGGNKELLIRALEGLPGSGGGLGGAAQMAAGTGLDIQPIINKVFETIGLAKVATSAAEAKQLGYLRNSDKIVANKDHQLYEAKKAVLALADGYRAPQSPMIPVAGREGRAVLELGLYNMRLSGYASEHDCLIGRKLAYVLTGGDLPAGTLVTEQYLLDLEREAFISLLKEKKSQDRMAYILKHGKPLRN